MDWISPRWDTWWANMGFFRGLSTWSLSLYFKVAWWGCFHCQEHANDCGDWDISVYDHHSNQSRSDILTLVPFVRLLLLSNDDFVFSNFIEEAGGGGCYELSPRDSLNAHHVECIVGGFIIIQLPEQVIRCSLFIFGKGPQSLAAGPCVSRMI